MFQQSPIIHTKLNPPRPHRYTLHRPRLTEQLQKAAAYRLTIVQANTGYGKSTAVAALAQQEAPVIWYHLSIEDTDPHRFLLHLLHGFVEKLPHLSEAALAQLERWEPQETSMIGTLVVDTLINELAQSLTHPLFLVIDDAHLLNNTIETLSLLGRLISHMPHHLHPILIGRTRIELPHLVTYRVRGELLEIGQHDLAFTAAEIAMLFKEHFEIALTDHQIHLLVTRTEGWPIALPLIWQRLQREQAHHSLQSVLGELTGSTSDLFVYLAQEVLVQQPTDIQRFLCLTAVLRELTSAACDTLRHASDSDLILRYLHANGLFVVNLQGQPSSRYHHLFRDFLLNQLTTDTQRDLHLRAADFFRTTNPEEALYHLFAAQSYNEAAAILNDLGRELVRRGRLDTLKQWLDILPDPILQNHPPLFTYRGDIARLQSRFDEALSWYKQAENHSREQGNRAAISQALRGQARVYLDTVNPHQAEQLLTEALRLADGAEDRAGRARLLKLLAENLLNQGDFKQAAAYQEQARQLIQDGPSEVELPVRMMLRTGRLSEARTILERQAKVEKQEPVLRPRAHRETQLLLSLVLATQGEQAAAHTCALQGIERGRALNSDFITSVGYSRQGHTHLLTKSPQGYEKARVCFQQAIQLSEKLMVPRLKIEPFWGLVQAYGFRGELQTAAQLAQDGISLAIQAGDEWISGLIRVTLGAAYLLASNYEAAASWLEQADDTFRECGDHFGTTITLLWQTMLWHQLGDETRFKRDMSDLLSAARAHSYDFIFHRPILLGPPNPRTLVPLLIFARDNEIHSVYAQRLLQKFGLHPKIETHPGYQLRVQMLGAFRLWRGREEIPASAWRRQKARQLFQYLITQQTMMLEREKIIDQLWPELSPEDGQRDFKIAFTTMCKVLEPNRDRKAPTAFVVRDGSRYGVRPDADIWVDAAEFEQLTTAATTTIENDRQAVTLYQGDYLQEYPYEAWCQEKHDQLAILYLRTAERLACALSQQHHWDEVVDLCELILQKDNCWEHAYRLLMQAYFGLDQRPQSLRTYQRCVETLQTELNVSPSAETTTLYNQIRAAAHISTLL